MWQFVHSLPLLFRARAGFTIKLFDKLKWGLMQACCWVTNSFGWLRFRICLLSSVQLHLYSSVSSAASAQFYQFFQLQLFTSAAACLISRFRSILSAQSNCVETPESMMLES